MPSRFAVTDPAGELSALNKLTVTGFSASTCPLSVPEPEGGSVAVGDPIGVDVAVSDPFGVGVAVAEPSGVEVAVSDPFGVCVAVAVSDPSGVIVADPSGVDVAVSDPFGVCVAVAVAEPSGVAVGDSTGVTDVGVSKGVGVDVAVGRLPTIVRLVPVEGRLVRRLSPFETRAVHSISVWPACSPSTLNVKAAPLVVALLPLLPAMATMKLPFCGSLMAAAASAPKSEVTAILLTSTRFTS